MRKILAVGGLMLIILGSSFLSLYNLPQKNNKMEPTIIKDIENELVDGDKWIWKVSWEDMCFEWNFSKGEEIIVAVWPYYDWAVPSFPEPNGMFLPPNSTQYFWDVKILRVNVTNMAAENFTIIEIYYPLLKPGSPTLFPDYFGVPSNTGALSLDEGYPKAGVIEGKGVIHLGKVKISGEYKVAFSMEPPDVRDEKIEGNTTKPWPHPVSPPYEIRLYKSVEENTYPYRSALLLFAGASTIIIGVMAIVKSRKPSRRRFKHKIRT